VPAVAPILAPVAPVLAAIADVLASVTAILDAIAHATVMPRVAPVLAAIADVLAPIAPILASIAHVLGPVADVMPSRLRVVGEGGRGHERQRREQRGRDAETDEASGSSHIGETRCRGSRLAVIVDLGAEAPSLSGIAAIRARYAELFARSPTLCSVVLTRTALGRAVVDLEASRAATGRPTRSTCSRSTRFATG
jgi:hypothetical protein